MKRTGWLAIVALICFGFQRFEGAIQLKPTEGIDELRFGISTPKDAKKAYARSLGLRKNEGLIISEPGCVKRTYVVLRSKDNAVELDFAGLNGTLSSVEVTSTGTRIGEALVIGLSNKQDVVDAYAVSQTVIDEYVELYLYVDQAWAEFEFDDSLVLRKVVLHAESYR